MLIPGWYLKEPPLGTGSLSLPVAFVYWKKAGSYLFLSATIQKTIKKSKGAHALIYFSIQQVFHWVSQCSTYFSRSWGSSDEQNRWNLSTYEVYIPESVEENSVQGIPSVPGKTVQWLDLFYCSPYATCSTLTHSGGYIRITSSTHSRGLQLSGLVQPKHRKLLEFDSESISSECSIVH